MKLAQQINEKISYRGHISNKGLVYIFGRSRWPVAVATRDNLTNKYYLLILNKNDKIHPSVVWTSDLTSGSDDGPTNIKKLEKLAKEESIFKSMQGPMTGSEFLQQMINKQTVNPVYIFKFYPELQLINQENSLKTDKYEIIYQNEKEAKTIEEIIKAAYDIIDKAGFSKINYGKFYSTPSLSAKAIADYTANTDSTRISNKSKKSSEAVRHVIHELGHRLWYKFLTQTQQKIVIDKYYQAASARDFKIEVGDKFIDEKGKEIEILSYKVGYPRGKDKYVFKYIGLESPKFEAPKGYFRRLKPIDKVYKTDPFDVSEYAFTDEKEFFSEVFSFGLVNKNKEILDWLKQFK